MSNNLSINSHNVTNRIGPQACGHGMSVNVRGLIMLMILLVVWMLKNKSYLFCELYIFSCLA